MPMAPLVDNSLPVIALSEAKDEAPFTATAVPANDDVVPNDVAPLLRQNTLARSAPLINNTQFGSQVWRPSGPWNGPKDKSSATMIARW
jgi:hypothetical protein